MSSKSDTVSEKPAVGGKMISRRGYWLICFAMIGGAGLTWTFIGAGPALTQVGLSFLVVFLLEKDIQE